MRRQACAVGLPAGAVACALALTTVTVLPALPGLPVLPVAPVLPVWAALPDLPGLPALPALPGLPTLPALPGLPAGPTLSGLPAWPALPGLPAWPALPCLTDSLALLALRTLVIVLVLFAPQYLQALRRAVQCRVESQHRFVSLDRQLFVASRFACFTRLSHTPPHFGSQTGTGTFGVSSRSVRANTRGTVTRWLSPLLDRGVSFDNGLAPAAVPNRDRHLRSQSPICSRQRQGELSLADCLRLLRPPTYS